MIDCHGDSERLPSTSFESYNVYKHSARQLTDIIPGVRNSIKNNIFLELIMYSIFTDL